MYVHPENVINLLLGKGNSRGRKKSSILVEIWKKSNCAFMGPSKQNAFAIWKPSCAIETKLMVLFRIDVQSQNMKKVINTSLGKIKIKNMH